MLPTITITPIEEDITNHLHKDQIQNAAFDLSQGRSSVAWSLPGVGIPSDTPECLLVLVDSGYVQLYVSILRSMGIWVQQFMHPMLVHHQLALGLHTFHLNELTVVSINNYNQFMAFQQWAHDFLSLLSGSQHDTLVIQQHLQSTTNSLRASLTNYVKEQLQSYVKGVSSWKSPVEAGLAVQEIGVERLVEQLN
ncbi:hypothetical protein DSO57_1017979 [Entomophthora muscae]|uniref:Uncharacterized protein n=1 Tax=Entomophthora muscae TaxID=34485 RepID=A0ACC2T4K7_9FUNG|nr:hypothetical protein DSO57_1017979 [Entomophthora muscae]